MRKHNPFARLPTSPSKRILMLAPVAVGSGSSRLYHRLPIAAGLTGKNPSTMDHHEMYTRWGRGWHLLETPDKYIHSDGWVPLSHLWVRDDTFPRVVDIWVEFNQRDTTCCDLHHNAHPINNSYDHHRPKIWHNFVFFESGFIKLYKGLKLAKHETVFDITRHTSKTFRL